MVTLKKQIPADHLPTGTSDGLACYHLHHLFLYRFLQILIWIVKNTLFVRILNRVFLSQKLKSDKRKKEKSST